MKLEVVVCMVALAVLRASCLVLALALAMLEILKAAERIDGVVEEVTLECPDWDGLDSFF